MIRKKEIWEELAETCDIKTIMLIYELIEIDNKQYMEMFENLKKDLTKKKWKN